LGKLLQSVLSSWSLAVPSIECSKVDVLPTLPCVELVGLLSLVHGVSLVEQIFPLVVVVELCGVRDGVHGVVPVDGFADDFVVNGLSDVDPLPCLELSDDDAVVNGLLDVDPISCVDLSNEDSVDDCADNGFSEVDLLCGVDLSDEDCVELSSEDSVGKGPSEVDSLFCVDLTDSRTSSIEQSTRLAKLQTFLLMSKFRFLGQWPGIGFPFRHT